MNLNLHPITRTYKKFLTLEDVYRTGWKLDGMLNLAPNAIENDSQHTYGVIVLNNLFHKYLFPNENRLILTQKSLIHEVGETNGIDVTPKCDSEKINNKKKNETLAVLNLYKNLITSDEQFKLWKSTSEGILLPDRLTRSADYLDTTSRAWMYESSSLPKSIREKLHTFFNYYCEKLQEPENYVDKIRDIHDEILDLRENHKKNIDKAVEEAFPILKNILTEYFSLTRNIFLIDPNYQSRIIEEKEVSRTLADRAVSRTFLAHIIMSETNSIDENVYYGLLDLEKDARNTEERFKVPYSINKESNLFSITDVNAERLVEKYTFLERNLYRLIKKEQYDDANQIISNFLEKN